MVLLQGCQPNQEVPPYAPVPACASSSFCDDASGFHPASGVDYIELRSDLGPNANYPTGCVASSAGVECSGATDTASCQKSVATITPAWSDVPGDTLSLITTAGNQVQTIALNSQSLIQFLAPIDSAQEAVLLARAADYIVDCSAPMSQVVQAVSGGYQVTATTGTGCGPGMDVYSHTLLVSTNGSITDQNSVLVMQTQPNCVAGRRPAGLCQPRPTRWQAPLGQHFAAMAALEAASVDAFRVLRAELKCHGAPRSLQELCKRAAADEVRHARVTGRLARRFQGLPVATQVAARPLRPLEQVALENEIEGCVRETFGALVGCWQAEHAAEPVVRTTMAGIAADELRHAALSWQVRTFAESRLTRRARTELAAARRQAIRSLRTELEAEPAPAVAKAAGLPSAAQAQALLSSMEREIWR